MDAVFLVSQLGGFLYTIGSFVVVLSIIVFVHEYGHYIVGRWSGIHPEVFSLGFGPVLASRVDKRGTRWQLAAFPFGGLLQTINYSRQVGESKQAELIGMTTVAEIDVTSIASRSIGTDSTKSETIVA